MMTNIEKLTACINSCENRRAVLNALMALAPIIREAKTEQQRKQLLEALKKGGAQA